MSSAATPVAPVKVPPSFREKVWGSTRLEPWFGNSSTKIGEVWFDLGAEVFPILTKFIFTTERLSVQVHPGDEYAARRENSRGKTEVWHVLRAEPGGQLALGPRQPLSPERLREAALSGEIESLLNWVDVSAGDTVFVPAGTIHAIGAGLVVAEIQEYSDVTYRLYDYGRPRELHLEKSMEVSDLTPYQPPRPPAGFLALCPFFALERITVDRPIEYQPKPGRQELLMTIEGTGSIAGQPFGKGEVWHIPAGAGPFHIEPKSSLRFLRTYVP